MNCTFEKLEDRRLLSAVVDIRGIGGTKSAVAAKVGDTIPLQIWVTITGKDANGANDGVQSITGSLLSAMLSSGSVKGDLSSATLPPFQANGSQYGDQKDLNGDGNLDIGSNDGSNIAGFFSARSGGMNTTGGNVHGASQEFLLGVLNYTVNSLGSSQETDLNFRPRVVIGLGYAGVWQEDNQIQDEQTSTLSAGAPFRIDPGAVQQPVQLTGSIIGTSGSYLNKGNTIVKAFDGNLTTYFDGPSADNQWAGLDLGSPASIAQVSYVPRASWAGRMVNGVFQASNDPTFSSNVVNLLTITSTPAYNTFTTANVSAPGTYRYVRYVGPPGSHGNVAELKFFGTPGANTHQKLAGTVVGTAGSYQNKGNTIAKAFDGNLSTFFDGPTANGNWAGLDTGSAHSVTQIKFAPRSGWASRMVGGIFQASNTANFSSGVVNLFTITTAPTVGTLTTVAVSAPGTFRYFRYLSPNGSYGDVAEIQFLS